MKIIQAILNFFKKLKRNRELKKRDQLYDKVTNILKPVNEKRKLDQNELIKEIKEQWMIVTGFHYGSKYIPKSATTKAKMYHDICNKYGNKMDHLGIEFTLNFEFRCI